MNTTTKVKTKVTKNDRLEEMDQKLDLLLKKVGELQAEVERMNEQQKPLIN